MWPSLTRTEEPEIQVIAIFVHVLEEPGPERAKERGCRLASRAFVNWNVWGAERDFKVSYITESLVGATGLEPVTSCV